MKVSFNDPDEFLREVRIDADRVDRKIVRLTVRRRYQQPFVSVSVYASAVIGQFVVTLDHRLGETFAVEELRATEVGKKVDTVLTRLQRDMTDLGLEVRPGVFEAVEGG
jgi:hypothetical protein